jgi:putative acetyltransferase
MKIECDNPNYCDDFVRLNEQWITEHFLIEDSDRELAKDPFKIVNDGGHIIALTENGRVLGVCALFKESDECFELARMAVDLKARGKGYGDILMQAALERVRERGASKVYLCSNTVLEPAIALYRKHGFVTRNEGKHSAYARANVMMELKLV